MDTCGCKNSSDVACAISKISFEQKAHYFELRNELTENLRFEELDCGYTFIYKNAPSILLRIVQLISYENQCCPFIKFNLHVSGKDEFIRLDLTGDEQVKALMKIELNC